MNDFFQKKKMKTKQKEDKVKSLFHIKFKLDLKFKSLYRNEVSWSETSPLKWNIPITFPTWVTISTLRE